MNRARCLLLIISNSSFEHVPFWALLIERANVPGILGFHICLLARNPPPPPQASLPTLTVNACHVLPPVLAGTLHLQVDLIHSDAYCLDSVEQFKQFEAKQEHGPASAGAGAARSRAAKLSGCG